MIYLIYRWILNLSGAWMFFKANTYNPIYPHHPLACLENGGALVPRVHQDVLRLHVPVNYAILVQETHRGQQLLQEMDRLR